MSHSKSVEQLYKEELSVNDFDVKPLDVNDRQELLNLLITNKISSKSYEKLGAVDALKSCFKLICNFPLLTKPYLISKIANKFFSKEIKSLLDVVVIKINIKLKVGVVTKFVTVMNALNTNS